MAIICNNFKFYDLYRKLKTLFISVFKCQFLLLYRLLDNIYMDECNCF